MAGINLSAVAEGLERSRQSRRRKNEERRREELFGLNKDAKQAQIKRYGINTDMARMERDRLPTKYRREDEMYGLNKESAEIRNETARYGLQRLPVKAKQEDERHRLDMEKGQQSVDINNLRQEQDEMEMDIARTVADAKKRGAMADAENTLRSKEQALVANLYSQYQLSPEQAAASLNRSPINGIDNAATLKEMEIDGKRVIAALNENGKIVKDKRTGKPAAWDAEALEKMGQGGGGAWDSESLEKQAFRMAAKGLGLDANNLMDIDPQTEASLARNAAAIVREYRANPDLGINAAYERVAGSTNKTDEPLSRDELKNAAAQMNVESGRADDWIPFNEYGLNDDEVRVRANQNRGSVRQQSGVAAQPKQQAPQAAVQYLRENVRKDPSLKQAFKAKYGYLPEGV